MHDVALEVQCEIYQFLNDDKNQQLLDPNKGAGVVLTLQTDLSGSVQYTGVNLSKLGFFTLAELVTASNKVPTLQGKGQGSTTVSAEVDFTVAQSYHTPHGWASKKPQPPQMIIKESDEPGPWEKAKFTAVDPSDPNNHEMNAKSVQPPSEKASKTPPFRRVDCAAWRGKWYNWYLKLSLDDWLRRYSAYDQFNLYREEPFVRYENNT